jgi:hypothetical protein
MKLRPLKEGAPGKSVWPAIDPYPDVHGLVLDFVGGKTCGRPFYKLLNDRYADVTQIPGWSYSGSTSNGLPRYAETRAGRLVPFAAGVPRITDRGLLIEGARTNKVTVYNANPTTTAGINLGFSGGTASIEIVDDTAALAAAGLATVASSGKVFRLSYTGVTFAFVQISGAVGNLNAHVGSVWARGDAGNIALSNNEGQARFSASSGYKRVSTPSVVPGATTRNLQIASASGTGVIYFILPQLEEGVAPSSTIVTTGASATRAADSATINGLYGILGQFRANMLSNSQAFGAASWTKSNATVINDTAAAPDGQFTAEKIVEAVTGPSNHGVQQSIGPVIRGTFSIYAKKGERDWLWLYFASYSAGSAWFDLTNGVVGTTEASIAASITDAGNGWWRCTIRQTNNNSAAGVAALVTTGNGVVQYAGDGVSGLYLWGAQVEAGSVATEYIRTTSAPAGAGTPITLSVAADLPAMDGVTRYLAQAHRNNGNRIVISRESTNGLLTFSLADSGGGSISAGAKTGARVIKSAARVRPTGTTPAADGTLVAPISFAPPSGLTTIDVGSSSGASSFLFGYVQRLVVLGDTDDTQLAGLVA